MTCFFDPSHGPGSTTVTWVPQWGVPRPIQTCVACGQRVQSAQPPYYLPQGAAPNGYPQAGPGVQQGYGGGYPQGYGYPGGDYPDQRHGHGHSTGAVVGAGVAGLVGGALLNEMLDDDRRPEIIENNTYVRNDEGVNPDAGGFFDGYEDQGGYDDGDQGYDGGDFSI